MPVSNDDTRIRDVGQLLVVESISLDPTASESIDKMVAFIIGIMDQRQLRSVYSEAPCGSGCFVGNKRGDSKSGISRENTQ